MNAVAGFLGSRTPRERLLLAIVAALALAWLLTTQVWRPMLAHRNELANGITRIDRALIRLQTAPEPAAAKPADTRGTTAVVTEAADRFGIGISRLQPQGVQVQVTLEDTPFEAVLLWIEALQGDDALRLVDLTLTRRPAPGIVGAVLTLER